MSPSLIKDSQRPSSHYTPQLVLGSPTNFFHNPSALGYIKISIAPIHWGDILGVNTHARASIEATPGAWKKKITPRHVVKLKRRGRIYLYIYIRRCARRQCAAELLRSRGVTTHVRAAATHVRCVTYARARRGSRAAAPKLPQIIGLLCFPVIHAARVRASIRSPIYGCLFLFFVSPASRAGGCCCGCGVTSGSSARPLFFLLLFLRGRAKVDVSKLKRVGRYIYMYRMSSPPAARNCAPDVAFVYTWWVCNFLFSTREGKECLAWYYNMHILFSWDFRILIFNVYSYFVSVLFLFFLLSV